MLANKTLLQMKYARIVKLFADHNHLSYEDALAIFYDSVTYELISNGVADMHCFSDGYLADELEIEWKRGRESGKNYADGYSEAIEQEQRDD